MVGAIKGRKDTDSSDDIQGHIFLVSKTATAEEAASGRVWSLAGLYLGRRALLQGAKDGRDVARPRMVAVVAVMGCVVVGVHHCTTAPRGAGAPCGHGHHIQVVSSGCRVWAVSCGHCCCAHVVSMLCPCALLLWPWGPCCAGQVEVVEMPPGTWSSERAWGAEAKRRAMRLGFLIKAGRRR